MQSLADGETFLSLLLSLLLLLLLNELFRAEERERIINENRILHIIIINSVTFYKNAIYDDDEQ